MSDTGRAGKTATLNAAAFFQGSVRKLRAGASTASLLGWNLAAGISSGLAVLLSAPLLLRAYGVDGFGVIGFWMALQVVMGLFDLGLSSTLGRHLAQRSSAENARDVLVTFERFAWGIALTITGLAAFSIVFLDHTWIRSRVLSQEELRLSTALLALSLCLQFPTVLYTGGITGVQQHRSLSITQLVVNLSRWGGGVAAGLLGAPLASFFLVQAVVSLAQSLTLRALLWRALGEATGSGRWDWGVLRQHWRFALGMAGTSSLSVLIANADRLIISKLLTAGELGIYAIAFLGSSALQLLLIPFYRVFYPKFSALVAAGGGMSLREQYLISCRWLSAFVVPVAVSMFVFAPDILRLWVQQSDPVVVAVFRCLVGGVAMASLSWLPGAAQQAHGWTTLHLGMLATAVLIGIPVAVVGVLAWGIVGATAVWLVHGALSVALEPWLMHRRILKGLLFHWYVTALFSPVLASVAVCLLLRPLMSIDMAPGVGLLLVCLAVAVSVIASILAQGIVIHLGKGTKNDVRAC
jgi:O-antigen/teichoic acid export membrane protein